MDVLTPHSLAEALSLKAELPDARFVQGGTDVLVELNFDRSRPPALINLNEVAELRGFTRENGTFVLGAGLTYAEAMTRRGRRRAAGARGGVAHGRVAADPQSRHDRRATSARRRRPATRCRRSSSRTPCVEIASVRGERQLPLAEFLLGVKKNALAPDELVVSVRVDPSRGRQTFMKVGPRNAMVISVCSLALQVDRERGEIRAAFGSASPTVRLVTAPLDDADGFPDLVAESASPIDDVRGTAAYRRHALRVLTRRALDRCLA